MSRGSSSLMNLLPFSSTIFAPSPRRLSEIMNGGLSGEERTVGWNWTQSMSISFAPASWARSIPSPVEVFGLVVLGNFWPIPPVARITAFA